MQPRNTGFIRRLLYDLKFRYGRKVIFNRETETNNPKTGKRSVSVSTHTVQRCAILPETADRQFIARLSNIVANREFQYGGWFDSGKRLFLVENADLGTWVPEDSDYLIYENRRWEISKRTRFEFDMGWVIEATSIEGPEVAAVYVVSGRDRLLFSDTAVHA